MNNNAYLKEENILTLLSLNNLIIPEIQREYVWGENPEVLRPFLLEIKELANPCGECHYVHTPQNINVGFLYSYKPPYAKVECERILDEYLIDGQQRMTTIFLLLLYRATVERRMDDFLSIIRVDDGNVNMAFDYKVRHLTERFISDLIAHVRNRPDSAFDFISDSSCIPSWLLGDYMSDPTVRAILKTLRIIQEVFDKPDDKYYDFLLTNIRFWHFKTEATSQGEELYITMNARGEQLVHNEMKKARILAASSLIEHGKKWEEFLDFFWKNRKCNSNADKGFNNYLAIIDGLENFFDENASPSVDRIKIYVDALKHITSSNFKNALEEKGYYKDWFDDFLKELWRLINSDDGDWNISNPSHGDGHKEKYNNQGMQRNKCMLLWPWMYYFTTIKNGEIEDDFLIRLIHFYYVRYYCYKRSSTTIHKVVDQLHSVFVDKNNILSEETVVDEDDQEGDNNSKLFSPEEMMLLKIYSCSTDTIEALLWKIQDIPYLKNAKGVGGDTIVSFFSDGIIDESNLEDSLKDFYDKMTTLLPANIKKEDRIKVKQLLLFYCQEGKTAFWKRQSPYYYENFETSDWPRIVRTYNFRLFYIEHVAENLLSLEDLLDKKRDEYFRAITGSQANIRSWSNRKLCILYDTLCALCNSGNRDIWSGKYPNIALWSDETSPSQKKIYGINRNFKGDYQEVKLPQDWAQRISDKYGVTLNCDTKE